jgi:hypothetical protein
MRELPTIGGRSGAHRRERARRPKQRSLAGARCRGLELAGGGAVAGAVLTGRGVASRTGAHRWGREQRPERCSPAGVWRCRLELAGGGGRGGRSSSSSAAEGAGDRDEQLPGGRV